MFQTLLVITQILTQSHSKKFISHLQRSALVEGVSLWKYFPCASHALMEDVSLYSKHALIKHVPLYILTLGFQYGLDIGQIAQL